MDVPRPRTIVMALVAHLRLRKHRQFLLLHYPLPQLHKGEVHRLPGLHRSLDIRTMLPTPLHMTHLDQALARSLYCRPMCRLYLRRLFTRQDPKLMSLRLLLPRRPGHWVLMLNRTQRLLRGYTARDHGTVFLGTTAILRTVESTFPTCRMVYHRQCRPLQVLTMDGSQITPTSHNLL